MRCVRPVFTMSANSSAFAASAAASRSSAGSRWFVAASSAARCTADGKTSFDDWPMFTWSLGCTPSPARFAITSLAFMLDDVPEPVWKTSIGNWLSWRPSPTSSAAAAMRSATAESSRPRSAFTCAAAALMRPSQWMTAVGIGSPETGKFSTAFRVSAPQSSVCPVVSVTPWRLLPSAGPPRHSPGAAVGGGEPAPGAAEGFGEGGGRVVRDRGAVAHRDGGGIDACKGPPGRERAHERMHGEGLVVVCDEIRRRAEDVSGDEEAALGKPQRDLVPAGEADDAALLDAVWEGRAERDAVAGGEPVGVAAVAAQEERDSGDGRSGERCVEL